MWQLIVGVALGLGLAMAFAWSVQRRVGNAGWVDVIWSFALGIAGLVYALFPLQAGVPTLQQWLIAAAAGIWSLRLGVHIAARTVHAPEDTRYANFRKEWGGDFQRRMFWFLQIQAAAAALLAVSMLLAARNPRPMWQLDVAGLVLLMVALAGEALADWQLRTYRSQPRLGGDSHGRICDVGLWSWSRHPNYFFEWLGWCAYPLFAICPAGGYDWAWFALSAPALMFWLLVHVSGIPPVEQQMLCSRGAAFEAYQARVSAFFPLPPPK